MHHHPHKLFSATRHPIFHSRLSWPRLNDFRTNQEPCPPQKFKFKILFWIVTKSSLTLVILIVISHWNLQTTNLVRVESFCETRLLFCQNMTFSKYVTVPWKKNILSFVCWVNIYFRNEKSLAKFLGIVEMNPLGFRFRARNTETKALAWKENLLSEIIFWRSKKGSF